MRAVLLLLALLVANDAFALRCGHRLVQVGDYKLDVLEVCGEPDSVERRTGIRGSRLRHPYGALEIDRFEEVEIEDWVYNFGPRKFKQLLEFEDGELKSIRNLGYGY
jgi:hypothetical protein